MTEPVVVMLDLDDGTLHRPGQVHLVTRCGVGPLAECTVGPFWSLHERAERLCPECWREEFAG